MRIYDAAIIVIAIVIGSLLIGNYVMEIFDKKEQQEETIIPTSDDSKVKIWKTGRKVEL